MGKSKAPKPPDPVKTAQAQAQYNTQAAKDAAALNAVERQHRDAESLTRNRATIGNVRRTPGDHNAAVGKVDASGRAITADRAGVI